MDKVKAKLQELCPDVMEERPCNCPNCECGAFEILGSPITLAVVLRAINEKGHFIWTREASDYYVEGAVARLVVEWDWEHDNYDQQSEECKQFIGSLLGV